MDSRLSSFISLVVLWSTLTVSTFGWLPPVVLLNSSLIRGPEPMTAVKPIGSRVNSKFTCVLNKTELPPGHKLTAFWAFWYTKPENAVQWNQVYHSSPYEFRHNGSLVSISYEPLIQSAWSGTCQISVFIGIIARPLQPPLIDKIFIINATLTHASTLTVYGPPEPPSNLTVSTVSSDTLVLSWSAPSSPVQLHYTVTVTVANDTITEYNTSSTNITINRQNIACDYDSLSVTASNPAGKSTPANLTTPLTDAGNVLTSYNGPTLHINATKFTGSVNISVKSGEIMVIAGNQCKSVSIPLMNFTRSSIIRNTYTRRQNELRPDCPNLPVWMIALAVIGAVLLVVFIIMVPVIIIGGFSLLKKNKLNTSY